jgi:hypothetical protein
MKTLLTLGSLMCLTALGTVAGPATDGSAAPDLDQTVHVATPPEGTSLPTLLRTVSDVTGISFHSDAGSNVTIRGSFGDVSVRALLNQICANHDLTWRVIGGVVVVESPAQTRIFTVPPPQRDVVQRLVEIGVMDRVFREGDTRGVQPVVYDEVLGLLSVTGPPDAIARVEEMMLRVPEMTQVRDAFETRLYQIERGSPERMAALLDARLRAETAGHPQRGVIDRERRILVEGDTLVVHDTIANLEAAEEILQDEGFVSHLTERGLNVRTYSLIPPDGQRSPEQSRLLADQIVETVQTLLYAESGTERAASEGRRLWYEPTTLQLTVTDHEDNLKRVDRYIRQIPGLGQPQRITVRIPIEGGRSASEVAARLGDFVSVRGSSGGTPLLAPLGSSPNSTLVAGVDSGPTTERTLSVGDEVIWRGVRLTLVDVSGPPSEPDTATFVLDSARTSEERSVRRLRSLFFGDFRVRVIDITRGGRVRVEISDLTAAQDTILR